MNGNEDNYHPIDISLVCYPTDDIQLTNVGEDLSEKDVRKKASKNLNLEEANPTEIYLYDQPQAGSRQDKEPVSIPRYPENGEMKTDASEGQSKAHESNEGDADNQISLEGLNELQAPLESKNNNKAIGRDEYVDSLSAPVSTRVTSEPVVGSATSVTTTELNGLTEQPFYVNAKQYYRILKRRYARAKLEENLRISRERKPYLHESRHKHAMRRPRGQGGRFLTIAEIEALKTKGGTPSPTLPAIETPSGDSEEEKQNNGHMKDIAINRQENGNNNKLACIKKK